MATLNRKARRERQRQYEAQNTVMLPFGKPPLADLATDENAPWKPSDGYIKPKLTLRVQIQRALSIVGLFLMVGVLVVVAKQ